MADLLAADDRPHAPAPGPWEESWAFDAVDGAVGCTVRLALRPAERRARWWTYVSRPGGGPVTVRDHDVVAPRDARLEIRADGLWAELVCETPLEHWGIGLEAFGVRLDDPQDARRGEVGHRLPVGLDLEWEREGPPTPARWPGGWRAAGFVQAGRLHGEILLAEERLAFDGPSVRLRAWGPPPWPPGWAWSPPADGPAVTAVPAWDGPPDVVVPLEPAVDGGAALERAVVGGPGGGAVWVERLVDR